MATGILGLGSGQAAALNQDLLDRLKAAERVSLVEPYETKINNITKEGGETQKLAEITAKANELMEAIKPFYQFVSGGVTVFDLKTANTTGSSVVFDTTNESNLNVGSTTVQVNQLATKDVYQSISFNEAAKSTDLNTGTLSISIAGADGAYSTNYSFDTTGKTYEELAAEINYKSELNASVEQVGDNDYRLVIKSAQSGSANALKISQDFTGATNSIDFNFDSKATGTVVHLAGDNLPKTGSLTLDGNVFSSDNTKTYQDLLDSINALTDSNGDNIYTASFDSNNKLVVSRSDGKQISITQDDFNLGLTNNGGKTVSAQNMEAVVDGINYSASTNVITVDGGLKITAVSVNAPNEYSTISVENDTAYIGNYLQNFVDKYNELVDMVDTELYSADSLITDKASLRTMMEGIKSKLFGSYGISDNGSSKLNVFNFGLEIDKSGYVSLDTEKLNDAISNNFSDLKSLFFDAYTRDSNNEVITVKGLGTELKEYLDSLDGFDGVLYNYQTSLATKEISLTAEKDKAQASLDAKYEQLALQFAEYGAIITQMESTFSGLKMLIDQSANGG